MRIELKGENLNAPYFPAVVYPKLDFSETSSVGKEVMKGGMASAFTNYVIFKKNKNIERGPIKLYFQAEII